MNFTIRKQKTGSIISSEPPKFINRELSWLNFNARVLDEARMDAVPLLDKLKFISIFSSNLDEFFMVRVAGLLHLLQEGINTPDPSGMTPAKQLSAIRKKLRPLLKQQQNLLTQKILPELEKNGIRLLRFADTTAKQQKFMRHWAEKKIFPALTPLTADQSQPFPLLNPEAIELAVKVFFPKRNKYLISFIEIPELFGRFIRMPGSGKQMQQEFLLIEDLIAENITILFPGGEITARQIFRITRDMDYSFDSDDAPDEEFLHTMQNTLRQRKRRAPVRLEFSGIIKDSSLQNYLCKALDISPSLCYCPGEYLHLKQFNQLPDEIDRPDLLETAWNPITPDIFKLKKSVFEAITQQHNILLVHPYHSFDPIIKLLEEAAEDPDVLAIKQTLYRVSGNSPVVKALQRAAINGKQVTVLVELKARFDESNNIAWAELLDHAGAHVAYGLPGLKVHAKVLLIVRREGDVLRRYVHFGSGNYNDCTARLYTDVSLLSCDDDLGNDAAILFNSLTSHGEQPVKWQAISTAPTDLRHRLKKLITDEINRGNKGRIIAKMNSFSDPELIDLIHRAAQSGVKIDLIVRGICCCRPLPGVDNLRIISIIDRYLEHSRIFYFGNGEKIFCSSADWMPRNLDRRVECMFPIRDPKQKSIIFNMLQMHLLDRDKGRIIGINGSYSRPSGKNSSGTRSQKKIFDLFAGK